MSSRPCRVGSESSSSEKGFWPTMTSCGDAVGIVSASDIVGCSKEEGACATLLIFESTDEFVESQQRTEKKLRVYVSASLLHTRIHFLHSQSWQNCRSVG